jgi:hypothetical protein
MRGDDLERIKRARERLTQVGQTLADASARQASAGTDPNTPREGEVVDAEYVDDRKG